MLSFTETKAVYKQWLTTSDRNNYIGLFGEQRAEIAKILFEVWVDAKEGCCEDDWGMQSFDELPEKHKEEYYLTTKRILTLCRDAVVEMLRGKAHQVEADEAKNGCRSSLAISDEKEAIATEIADTGVKDGGNTLA